MHNTFISSQARITPSPALVGRVHDNVRAFSDQLLGQLPALAGVVGGTGCRWTHCPRSIPVFHTGLKSGAPWFTVGRSMLPIQATCFVFGGF